ncbi:MAG: hypothetical protein IJA72_04650 [Clostridia bacterium]|nr:hypothetical protein [Clostridia bacterium]
MKITKKEIYENIYNDLKEIYQLYINGGAMRMVLSDMNVDDGSILYCIKEIRINYKKYCKKKDADTINNEQMLFLRCANDLLSVKSKSDRLDLISRARKEVHASSIDNNFNFGV